MKSFTILLVSALLTSSIFAAKLNYIHNLNDETLENIAKTWNEITLNLKKNCVGSHIEHVEFKVVKQNYQLTNTADLIKVMKEVWYTYAKEHEYKASATELTGKVTAPLLKKILKEVITDWSSDKVDIGEENYNKLVWITNALNQNKMKIIILEQSFSDGGLNGVVILDSKNKQTLLLGNRLAY